MTYSVVVTDNIRSVIHTDPEGAQQVIALDVTEGYAEGYARFLNLTKDNAWLSRFDARQLQEIKFSTFYAREFNHGTDGHNAKMIIAKLSEVLSELANSS